MRIYRGVNLDYDARFEEIESQGALPCGNQLEKFEVKESPVDSLLKIIYSPDPVTGLPTGDLSYYVSDSVNPDIKAFVLQNLMFDTSNVANVKVPDGIDAELAFALQRGHDEDSESYASRIKDYMDKNIELIKRSQNEKETVQSD